MTLDPTSLRLFVAVVEEASIAKAAEREHIAAAARKSLHFAETLDYEYLTLAGPSDGYPLYLQT